jgi:hypothetical protein
MYLYSSYKQTVTRIATASKERKGGKEESQSLLELRSELGKRDKQIDSLNEQVKLLTEQHAKTNLLLERLLGMTAGTPTSPAFAPMLAMQAQLQASGGRDPGLVTANLTRSPV